LRFSKAVPIREFTDSHGVAWRVWSVFPTNPSSVNNDLRDGWLSFDSGTERRRVGPIPKGWESFNDERLELALRVASPARRSDPHIAIPDDLPDDESG
jgi:hypothetical protein